MTNLTFGHDMKFSARVRDLIDRITGASLREQLASPMTNDVSTRLVQIEVDMSHAR